MKAVIVNLNFGLSGTSIVTGLLLAVVLAFQFKPKRYIPGIYWLTAALISVFGTLVSAAQHPASRPKNGLLQAVGIVSVLLVLGVVGFNVRQSALLSHEAASSAILGDLSSFQTITQDTLDKLNAGHQPGATKRVNDLESEWDTAQSSLKSKNVVRWTLIDGKIDTVLTELRAKKPDQASEKAALQNLLEQLN